MARSACAHHRQNPPFPRISLTAGSSPLLSSPLLFSQLLSAEQHHALTLTHDLVGLHSRLPSFTNYDGNPLGHGQNKDTMHNTNNNKHKRGDPTATRDCIMPPRATSAFESLDLVHPAAYVGDARRCLVEPVNRQVGRRLLGLLLLHLGPALSNRDAEALLQVPRGKT